MSRTTTQIQTDIDALRSALSQPAREIRFQNRTTIFKDVNQIQDAIATLSIELNEAQVSLDGSSRIRQVRLSGSSGF